MDGPQERPRSVRVLTWLTKTSSSSIAANAPVSVQQTLQAVDAVLSSTDDKGWAVTVAGQAAVMASDDMAEGVQAFLEKRPPEWTGR